MAKEKQQKDLIDDNELAKIKTLGKALAKKDNTPVTFTEEEFEKYIPLFRDTSNLSEEEMEYLSQLSEEFYKHIDLYKPFQVLRNGRVILEFPAIWTPIRNMDQKYVSSIDKFNHMSTSDIPRYRAEAFDNMITDLMKSQLDDENIQRLRSERESHSKRMDRFYAQLAAIKDGKVLDTSKVNEIVSDDISDAGVDWEEDE